MLILMTTILLIIGNIHAQNKRTRSKFKAVILEGRITDSLIKHLPGGKSTLYVTISPYPFSVLNMAGAKADHYEVVVKHNEMFKLRIPPPTKRFYMYIEYQAAFGLEQSDVSWSWADNIYILDQGDSIHVELGKDLYKFSGRGAEKLNCESEIYKNTFIGYGRSDTDEEQLMFERGDYKNYNAIIDHKMDSLLILQKAIVDKYRGSLGDELSKILLANCYGQRYYAMLRSYRLRETMGYKDVPVYRSAVIEGSGYRNIDFGLLNKIKPDILVQSPLFVDAVFEKIRFDNFVVDDKKVIQIPIYLKQTFNDIKIHYSGVVRDKLLALFFVNLSRANTGLDYLEEAISLCGPTIYKTILLDLKRTKTKGRPFYPFELPDTKGNMVKLANFGSKVIILDFWYTGCENCVNLHHNMKVIHEKFSNDPNVAFVSISIDKDRTNWVKSVSKGIYTDPGDVNLYTNGQAAKHPLLTKYAIESFPTVFVLKNGKIISSNPSLQLDQAGIKQFADLIENAISDKSF